MPGPHGSESSGPVKYRDLGVGGRERSVLVRGIVAPIFRCGKNRREGDTRLQKGLKGDRENIGDIWT